MNQHTRDSKVQRLHRQMEVCGQRYTAEITRDAIERNRIESENVLLRAKVAEQERLIIAYEAKELLLTAKCQKLEKKLGCGK